MTQGVCERLHVAIPHVGVFILKELNAAECEGLACETTTHLLFVRDFKIKFHNCLTCYLEHDFRVARCSLY